jgi:hypothetical protein
MLYRMENSERIALLLEIIADELYIARTDREGVSGSGPDIKEAIGHYRDDLVAGIQAKRETLVRY